MRHGLSTAARAGKQARIRSVEVTDHAITAHLMDGRSISVPLTWSWRLSRASSEQRQRYELIGEGSGVRWPDVDEDISLRGMLEGTPAKRPG